MNQFFVKLFCILFFLGIHSIVFADDDHHERDHDEHDESQFVTKSHSKVHQLYLKECGDSCHIAFPASMLAKSNWNKIMQSLNNHFGDNAELDIADQELITSYLQYNGANNLSWSKSSNTLRITETRHFRHEHDEVSARFVGQNANIKSLADCQSCHTRASKGLFSERDIKIPGFGVWDD